jgi:hypothetical protein
MTDSSAMNEKTIQHGWLGLIDKRERWGLTVWGWAAVVLAALVAGLVSVPSINGFLTYDNPVRGQALVVEGWIPDYAIPGAITEFDRNGYKVMIAVGEPIQLGAHLSEFKNYARLTQARLAGLGFDQKRLVVLETGDIRRDRTYASAEAVKRWIDLNHVNIQGMNVYTLGAHARRSRLLFQKAFGNGIAIGVIAVPDQSYDPGNWWKSSNGVRTVLDELIAYFYAVVFFHG